MAEHNWTRESAGLFDVSHMGQLLFTGEDADKALETLLPGDITGLKPGRVRYSLLLAEDGGIVDDLMVTRRPDGSLYVVVNGSTKAGDIAYIRINLPAGVRLQHLTDQALLAVQGPQAVAAAARVIPGVDALGFMTAGAFDWEGRSLWISRTGYTGEDGLEISVPAAQVEALAEALVALPEVKPIGLGARDSLRLEAGLPLYGHDLGLDRDPAMAELGFAVSKRRRAEGGFPGADLILRHLNEGAPLRRVGLMVDGRQPAREGASIHDGHRTVGTVTSGGFAPSVGQPIAMGYVDADCAAPGTPLEIEVRGKRLAARVVALPFVPHRYHRKER
jgi:aminomethyltransferase